MKHNLRIGVIGATGFTGSELLRLLVHHPNAEVTTITSESRKGERFSDVHPFFEGIVDQQLMSVDDIDQNSLDAVFLALPHGVSMEYVKRFENAPFKIIDLSGDFRLSEPSVYEEWYKKDHSYPEGFGRSVYGIPELYPEEIKACELIANPGCFPTGSILGIAPLVREGLVKLDQIIVDAKTGVTGAGVKSKPVNHFSNVNENFKAYGVTSHRHSIEIQEQVTHFGGNHASIQFTPHLLPVDRGILSTIYLRPQNDLKSVQSRVSEAFNKHYRERPFIRLREQPPEIKHVRGTNFCDISWMFDERTGNLIVITAIDNLVRGAAGQAIQNMNLMFDLPEASGLNQIPTTP